MDPQILVALTGAVVGGLIAIVSGIVGAIIQYRLSIRLEKMRFQQQKELAEAAAKRQRELAEFEVMRQRDLAEFQHKKQIEEADRKRKQDQEDEERKKTLASLGVDGPAPATVNANWLSGKNVRYLEQKEDGKLELQVAEIERLMKTHGLNGDEVEMLLTPAFLDRLEKVKPESDAPGKKAEDQPDQEP